MKESNFTAITPRPKTSDFTKRTFKSLRKKLVPAKTVIRASKNSDYKTGAATNRVAFAAAPFPIPRAEKAEPKLKRLLSPPFPANFIIAY